MAKEAAFDLVIIGAGPGGYVAAIRAAQRGMRTALVEKRGRLGGTCLNIGCIPSKALLDSSGEYWKCQNGLADHGIVVESVKLDLGAMMRRKDAVVETLTSGVRSLMKRNKVTVYTGTARIAAPGEVHVETDDEPLRLKGSSIILATGSVPQELPFLKIDGRRIVSSEHALEFDDVPDRLAVIGAGAIGLELGSVWARLGSKVTVVELLDSVLPGWDGQVSRTLERELTGQGLTVHTATRVTEARTGEKSVALTAEDSDGAAVTLEADRVLVAVGRRALVPDNASELGIELDGSRVKVDDRFQTSVSGVYAIGDLIAGPMLAHKAEEDALACVDMIAGLPAQVDYGLVPNVVYTWPEAASVGRSEERLKEEGTRYAKGVFRFAANGRALASGDSGGFVKVLAREDDDRILGAHIVGPWASTLIAEIVVVMAMSGSAEDIGAIVHAHPTLPEAVREAALAVSGMAIHTA